MSGDIICYLNTGGHDGTNTKSGSTIGTALIVFSDAIASN